MHLIWVSMLTKVNALFQLLFVPKKIWQKLNPLVPGACGFFKLKKKIFYN